MNLRYSFLSFLLLLPITLIGADNKQSEALSATTQPDSTSTLCDVTVSTDKSKGSDAGSTQPASTPQTQAEQKSEAAQAQKIELNDEEMIKKQQAVYTQSLEAALATLQAKLPQAYIPKIEKPTTQTSGIGLVRGWIDYAERHAVSADVYLRKHVEGETLHSAFSTDGERRSFFGQAAIELAKKAKDRKSKNITKRMGDLIAWSDAYGIALNPDDLAIMREATLNQLNSCVATLHLLDLKRQSIRTDGKDDKKS